MARNLALGVTNGRVGKNLQNFSGKRGRRNGNAGIHTSASTISGTPSYPNVVRQTQFINGSRTRGATLDTRLDPKLYQP